MNVEDIKPFAEWLHKSGYKVAFNYAQYEKLRWWHPNKPGEVFIINHKKDPNTLTVQKRARPFVTRWLGEGAKEEPKPAPKISQGHAMVAWKAKQHDERMSSYEEYARKA